MGSSMTKGTGLPLKAVAPSTLAATMPTRMPSRYRPIITRAAYRGKKAAVNTP